MRPARLAKYKQVAGPFIPQAQADRVRYPKRSLSTLSERIIFTAANGWRPERSARRSCRQGRGFNTALVNDHEHAKRACARQRVSPAHIQYFGAPPL